MDGALVVNIIGADLIAVIEGDNLPPSELYGITPFQPNVAITVYVPDGCASVAVYGSPDLAFEYSNIVVSAP